MNRNVCRFVEFNQFLSCIVHETIHPWSGSLFACLFYCIDNTFWFLFLFGPYHFLSLLLLLSLCLFAFLALVACAILRFIRSFRFVSHPYGLEHMCAYCVHITAQPIHGIHSILVIEPYILGSFSAMSVLVYQTPLKFEKFAFFRYNRIDARIRYFTVADGRRCGYSV